MFKLTFVLLATVQFAHSASVLFYDCGKGEIESISIEPCKRMPCHFNEGDQANLTITFTPTTPSNQIEIRSTLRTAGLINYEVQVNFDDPMICQNGDSRKDFGKIPCPIVPGETYTFVASRKFPVNTSYNIFTYSKVRLVNEYGQNVGCADWVLQFNRAEQPITDDESRK